MRNPGAAKVSMATAKTEILHDWMTSLHGFLLRLIAIISTLPRDLLGLYVLIRVSLDMQYFKLRNWIVTDRLERIGREHPDKPCFIFEDEVWTFADVNKQVDLVHRYFGHKYSLQPGDVIGLLMNNHPKFPCIWLGLAKLGVATALLNTNLKKEQLAHCINICGCSLVIYSNEFEKVISDLHIENHDVQFVRVNIRGNNNQDGNCLSFQEAATFHPMRKHPDVCHNDVLLYIFTSGTTGFPKAAKVRHSRFFLGACGCYHGQRLQKSDIIYNALPLYHAMGGWLCLSYALLYGNTVVIKRKFSASAFWKDCVNYNCTFFMYIGEMCRYLVNSSPSKYERFHSVRSGAGNGLRKEVWEQFLVRFGDVKLVEFYAATEGNAYFFNFEGIPGPCGFNSIIFPFLLPSVLIEVDDQFQPVRTSTGVCIRCQYGETGMLVCPITQSVWNRFDGYQDKSDTAKKIAIDVRRKGDKYFVTGDLMRQDDLGYYHFVDRVGDTFRWRGENVSTFELEDALMKICGGRDLIVYGVAAPGYEGRCGMIALAPTSGSNDVKAIIRTLSQFVWNSLPDYARPVFLRICTGIDTTGTFKLSKQKLQKEGITRELIETASDPFYRFSKDSQQYEPLTVAQFDKILSGSLRI